MTAAERDSILLAAAALAEHEYQHVGELTDFEAFGPEDLKVEAYTTIA